MRRLFIWLGLAGLAGAFLGWWRRHPRFGAAYVNRVVDPWLVRQGVIEQSDGELGLIEHVGRVSGTVRRTPVHPVATASGFRIVVPLGTQSQWARNVLAAGHCRLAVGAIVHDLDEPALVGASEIEELPRGLARVMDWLGFRYLRLHRVAQHEGTLDAVVVEPATTVAAEPAPTPSVEPAAAA